MLTIRKYPGGYDKCSVANRTLLKRVTQNVRVFFYQTSYSQIRGYNTTSPLSVLKYPSKLQTKHYAEFISEFKYLMLEGFQYSAFNHLIKYAAMT